MKNYSLASQEFHHHTRRVCDDVPTLSVSHLKVFLALQPRIQDKQRSSFSIRFTL